MGQKSRNPETLSSSNTPSVCTHLRRLGLFLSSRNNRVVLATTPVNTAHPHRTAPQRAQSERSGSQSHQASSTLVLLLLHTTHHHALLSALSSITPTPTPSVLYPLIGLLVSAHRCPPPAQSPRLGPRPNGYRQTDRIFDQTQGGLSDALACSNPRISTPGSCCTAAYRPSNPKLGRLGLQRSSP